MNKLKLPGKILVISFLILAPVITFSQITSDADAVVPTEYSGGNQDNIHIFCGEKDAVNGTLTASYPEGGTGNFEWQKYNAGTGAFDFYSSDLSGSASSTISGLADGCYRVKLSPPSGDIFYTAWVFNNFIEATAEIPNSDCDSFTLKGTFNSPTLAYVDLTNGQPLQVAKTITVTWSTGSTTVSHVLTTQVFDPPTTDTVYLLEVSDGLGCTGTASVTYISIVTKASFEYKLEGQEKKSDPSRTEAPLTVTFTNTSENGDAGKYEWFIFKDIQKIKDEIKAGTFNDSIQDILYNDSPVYTFEETGEYKVKLVSTHVSEFTTCTDTFYIDQSIVADSSFIEAPNVFTPNGDGINDIFAIKFFSMKTVKVSIFNRWGKVLHVYENNNVQGFYNTATSIPESVWDGKIGGRMATPGVYYYVVEGIGRDGEKRKAHGFFHLFRDN